LEFIGEVIKHKVFGIGKITEFKDDFIKIKFDDIEEEKDFIYPDSFDSYLVLKNELLSKQVEDELVIFRKKEAERAFKAEELKKDTIRLKLMTEVKNNIKKSAAKKNAAKKIDSNIAFKCNYCDGGSNNENIGYKAVCSDEIINQNINNAKNKWCSDPESACYQYLQGNISREELNLKYNENKNICYESQMLNQWRGFPGISNNSNNLALLTTKLPKEKEKDRLIFAVFLIQEYKESDNEIEGYLVASKKYRIELSMDESKKLKFWDFYFNLKNPEKIANNSGLYRYFTDIQAAQVLKTICEIKKGSCDEALSIDFLNHFSKIKKIDINEIPALNGALQGKGSLVS